MKHSTKYGATGLIEAQFEPGSGGRVLKNRLGIKRKREMDKVELEAQLRAFTKLAGMFNIEHRFTAKDICRIHEVWLGDIYGWAGRYRQVNVSKGEFPFAGAAQIPKLMKDIERGVLKECRAISRPLRRWREPLPRCMWSLCLSIHSERATVGLPVCLQT